MAILEYLMKGLNVDIKGNFRRVHDRIKCGYFRAFLKSSWEGIKRIFLAILEDFFKGIFEELMEELRLYIFGIFRSVFGTVSRGYF